MPLTEIEEGNMAVAGEDIEAGSSVILSCIGKVFSSPSEGVYVGTAVERIREGFRISVKNCDVREDDA